MAGFLGSLLQTYRVQMERHHTLPFLRATMAASAMVATADGNVSFTERVRVDQILTTLEELKVFDPHEGVDLFTEYAEAILDNPKDGHERAVAALDAVADDAEQSELMIRICLAVAEAKAETTLADEIEIVSLCSRLGVDAAKFGLYKDELLKLRDGK